MVLAGASSGDGGPEAALTIGRDEDEIGADTFVLSEIAIVPTFRAPSFLRTFLRVLLAAVLSRSFDGYSTLATISSLGITSSSCARGKICLPLAKMLTISGLLFCPHLGEGLCDNS